MKKFIVNVNGTKYEVDVEEVKDGAVATPVAAPTTQKLAAAPAAPAKKADTSAPAGAQTIKSPMPGTILKVNFKVGDNVKKGQALLVLEAMKMENEIVAPSDGVVASVNVSQGSSVSTGEVLISLN